MNATLISHSIGLCTNFSVQPYTASALGKERAPTSKELKGGIECGSLRWPLIFFTSPCRTSFSELHRNGVKAILTSFHLEDVNLSLQPSILFSQLLVLSRQVGYRLLEPGFFGVQLLSFSWANKQQQAP